MDERKLESSQTKIGSSYLGELPLDDNEFSVQQCSENLLLLRKVEELYGKLQLQLEECIRLKTENEKLRQAQMVKDRHEPSVFEQNDRVLFGMFMEKIAQLEEQNRILRAQKENSIGTSGFSKQRSEIIFSPRIRNSNIPRIPTSPTKMSSMNSSTRDDAPTTRQLLRAANSIDQLWQGAVQTPTRSMLCRK